MGQEEAEIYNQRRAIGQIAYQKSKYAKEQPFYPEAPKELIAASDLIKQQQEILARNGENQRKRQNLEYIKTMVNKADGEVADLERKLQDAIARRDAAYKDLQTANKSALDLQDESTEELEKSITNIEQINRKVRANLDKDKAEEDAKIYAGQYQGLTAKIDAIRQAKIDLLKTADLPLPGLTVADGELLFNGYKWDGMSGSDQLKVATAIVRKLNPECGFVLLDKLEQMDSRTLKEFGAWLEAEGLQAIATRVSTGSECSIIIEDGYGSTAGYVEDPKPEPIESQPVWKPGQF